MGRDDGQPSLIKPALIQPPRVDPITGLTTSLLTSPLGAR